jgi:uncharacterized protein
MAAEAEVLEELRGLRNRVPQLTGALAAGADGLLIAQDTPGIEADRVAALTATVLGVAVRMTDVTGQGGFRELLVRSADGYLATYAAGRSAVLTLLAQDRVNVGRLHLEGRRAGTRIGQLLDAEPGAAAGTASAALPAAPAPDPEHRESPTSAANPRKAAGPRKTTKNSGSAKRPAKTPAGEPAKNSRTAGNTRTSTQKPAQDPADASAETSAKDRTPAKATPTRTK